MKFKSHQPTSFRNQKSESKVKSFSRNYQKIVYSNLENDSPKKIPSIFFKRTSHWLHETGYQAIVCPRKVLIKKRNQDSVYGRRSKGRSFITSIRIESSETSDSSNDTCSVGSCSFNSLKKDGFFERNLGYSDAESVLYPSDDKEVDPNDCLKKKVEVSVHSLELYAYRCTLEVLFVSGSLSWEQEELLTNLRINLHISNDEHLKLLRNL